MASYVHCNPLSPRAHRRDEHQAGPSGIVRSRDFRLCFRRRIEGAASTGRTASTTLGDSLARRAGVLFDKRSTFLPGGRRRAGRPLWPLCGPAGRRVGDSLEGRRGRRRSQGLAFHQLEKTTPAAPPHPARKSPKTPLSPAWRRGSRPAVAAARSPASSRRPGGGGRSRPASGGRRGFPADR